VPETSPATHLTAGPAVTVLHEPAYRVEDLRRAHPNTHRRWTPEDEQQLRDRFAQGATIGDLVAELGRNEGGITARLIRLGLMQPPPPVP
jgi:hypothetical protein